MNKPKKWLEKLSDLRLHEKVIFLSLTVVLLILSFDFWIKNLPVTGQALGFITLLLIGCTTWITCHGIKWLLHCDKPLKFYISHKSENERLKRIIHIISQKEDYIFDKFFHSKKDSFALFMYPTTLNEQIRLLIKDIERDFVKPWYSQISQNPSFLFDTHLLLEEIFFKIIEKLKTVNYKNLILRILMLYLNHLQEFKKSLKKISKLKPYDNSDTKSNEKQGTNYCDEKFEPKEKISESPDVYRYVHPGSQNDLVLNYYLIRVMKWLLQEYAPQEFVVSLQCKILTNILAKQLLRAGLTIVEDPNWIYINLINLFDDSKYNELLGNRKYVVKEKVVGGKDDADETKIKKPLTKRYLKSNFFEESTNLFSKRTFISEQKGKGNISGEEHEKKAKSIGKENLSLKLNSNFIDDQGSHISSVLSGIIPSTAGPLLPENTSVCYQPLNKMWQSPVVEEKKELALPFAAPIGKTIVEGVKIETGHSGRSKRLSRSKSTDTMSPMTDINEPLKGKDISIGEELCENAILTSKEDLKSVNDDIVCSQPRQIGNPKKLVKTKSFDSGSISMDSAYMESASEVKPLDSITGHQKENGAGDVSPVYEEPEDFATTIAKLRSLLQQRESSSTLSDKSSQSIEIHSNNTSFAESSDFSTKTHSTDLENSSFESRTSCDLPTDGRLFMNISIPKTELISDGSGSSYIVYSIQYDGIFMVKKESNTEEHELVLQTVTVKRRFQEFLNLETKLEECNNLKSAMKGIQGPSIWLNLPFSGRVDESTAANRKSALEVFLQQLCSKTEICAAPELHEFLSYENNGIKTLEKKDTESSSRRIDKLFSNRMSDVFNTIKTALPSFDFDSPASIATSDSSKSSHDQKLLPGFLSFGSKNEEYELNFDYEYKDPTGESLADDIRRFFNRNTDGIEHGLDVLNSNDWLAEKRECRPVTSEGKCVWQGYKDYLDDDMDSLDSWLPVYSVILDILCELLEGSDCWATKEPVIRLIKVLTGHWESKLQSLLSELDWDQISGNVIRLMRSAAFQPSDTSSSPPETVDLDTEKTKTVLKELLLNAVPNYIAQFIKSDGITSAVLLFIDSFQSFRANRDVFLRLMDILLVQLLSCRHLSSDFT